MLRDRGKRRRNRDSSASLIDEKVRGNADGGGGGNNFFDMDGVNQLPCRAGAHSAVMEI